MRPLVIGIVLALATTAGVAASPHPARDSNPQSKDEPGPRVVYVHDADFRWGDAGIGAAGGFGVAVAAGGLVALARFERARTQATQKEHER
jgi:hypothetical protein